MSTTEMIQKDAEGHAAREHVDNAAEGGSMSREAARETSSDQHEAPQRVVPVTEAKKYRKRAQQAEQSLAETKQELETKSQRLRELEQTVEHLERRNTIDELLIEADAIDLEAARLLTEATVQQMDEPDAAEAVEELRRTKPFLFRTGGGGAMRMSARIDPAQSDRVANDSLDHAAAEAHATGDRTDLLRYLRLRRKRQ